jgi:uncharacterized protein YggT (Ycf19 family)
VSAAIAHLANYTLAFLMWMIVGRGCLRLIVGEQPNVVMIAFAKVTEPVYALARRVLPFVGERWVPAVSFFAIAAVRVAMILAFRPVAGQ